MIVALEVVALKRKEVHHLGMLLINCDRCIRGCGIDCSGTIGWRMKTCTSVLWTRSSLMPTSTWGTRDVWSSHRSLTGLYFSRGLPEAFDSPPEGWEQRYGPTHPLMHTDMNYELWLQTRTLFPIALWPLTPPPPPHFAHAPHPFVFCLNIFLYLLLLLADIVFPSVDGMSIF